MTPWKDLISPPWCLPEDSTTWHPRSLFLPLRLTRGTRATCITPASQKSEESSFSLLAVTAQEATLQGGQVLSEPVCTACHRPTTTIKSENFPVFQELLLSAADQHWRSNSRREKYYLRDICLKLWEHRDFPGGSVVQWFKTLQRIWVWSLVGQLRFHMPWGQKKHNNNHKTGAIF